MSSINDAQASALIPTYGGDVTTGLFEWAGDNGGTGDSLNDRLFSLLASEGYTTGSLNDRLHAFLVAQGYTGSLTDMWYNFWLDGGTLGGWTPAELFASGEVGAWYDPSDLDTMFENNSGSFTPEVVAVEQPVGLVLDKSKGLALGPELATTLLSSSTGWTLDADATLDGGVLTIADTPNSGSTNYQIGIGTEAGKVYKITLTVNNTNTNPLSYLGVTVGSAGAQFKVFGSGEKTIYVKQGGATANRISFSSPTSAVSYFNGTVTNVSVKEVYGNHASQATAANRPVLRARHNLLTYSEQFDNAVWAKSRATITANAVTAPDGTTTADQITTTAITGTHLAAQNYADYKVGVPMTFSCYAKAGTHQYFGMRQWDGASLPYASFDLTNLTYELQAGIDSASIEDVGDGWRRCSITYTPSQTNPGNVLVSLMGSSAANSFSWAGTGAEYLYVWGAQLDVGTTARPYQRIAAATDYVTSSTMEDYDFPYYLAFDGVDDFLYTPTTIGNIEIPTWCIFCAGEADATGTLGICSWTTGGGLSTEWALFRPAGSTSGYKGSAADGAAVTYSYGLGTGASFVVGMNVLSGDQSFYLNGTDVNPLSETTVVSLTQPDSRITLGASTYTPAGLWNGRLYGAIFRAESVSDEVAADVNSWLAAKAGI